jgi:N-acetylglutamate synthase-like GNAT family acetyltransferase
MEISSRPAKPGSFVTRRARFEDVPEILRVISRAVERGCREHYDADQRRAVYLTYGTHLFVEALEPYDLLVAELDGRLVGAAQLDPAAGRLRALFVDGPWQGGGLGAALLADVETRALGHGLHRIHGAMSLNAVPFYAKAGFHPTAGPRRLSSVVLVPVVPMEKRLGRASVAGQP